MKIRVGHGYDVHRWGSDKPLILGGVNVEHHQHFPDTDERYAGADSAELLSHAVQLCQEKEFRTGNIDVTIVAQAPKMAPHIDDMRASIAQCLKTCVDNVNVKATTTEKLGFVGREEGIACHAVVLMESL